MYVLQWILIIWLISEWSYKPGGLPWRWSYYAGTSVYECYIFQAIHEDEDDNMEEGIQLISTILGHEKIHLYPSILQLVMADGVFTEGSILYYLYVYHIYVYYLYHKAISVNQTLNICVITIISHAISAPTDINLQSTQKVLMPPNNPHRFHRSAKCKFIYRNKYLCQKHNLPISVQLLRPFSNVQIWAFCLLLLHFVKCQIKWLILSRNYWKFSNYCE